jgi:2-furoyl-CoA dehydrogenase large subunit
MDMSFNGEFEVAIPREETFDLLVDPQKFIPVLPTYHSMSMKEDEENTAIVKVKVGIGKIHGIATTEMSLNLCERPQKAGYIGKGKVMGGAYNMITSFELSDTPSGGTLIKWEGTTQIYGKILSLAGGGMRGYAEKEITKVIDSLQAALSSKEAFEAAVAKANAQASEGIMTGIINFFKGLFGIEIEQRAAAEDEAEKAPAEPVHKDPVIPFTPMQDSITANADQTKKWVGQRLNRKEDSRLVRGRGLFVDDNQASDMLHIGFVRSPYAHAKIVNIDTSAIDAMEGVTLALTGAQCAAQMQPFMQMGPAPGANLQDFGIAVERVRYQGEPVVAVVAESARLVEDAIDAIEVEYDILPAVVASEDSQKDETLLHEEVGSNTIFKDTWEHGEVDKAFAEADKVVKIGRMHFHRFSSTPIETAGAVVSWSKQGDIEIFANSGLPPINSQMIAMSLGVSTEQIRSRSHDVGGNFGTKTVIYPFVTITALASKTLGGRQIKWVETRTDNLQSFHGGERTFHDTEVALSKEGDILAIRSRHIDDCGAFPRYEPLGCVIWSQVYPHTYKVRNLKIDFSQVVANKTPCTPNRGYSRLQHSWFMERVIDICAQEMGIPGDEMRLRNYIKPEQFPYETPNGCVYDSGNYPGLLEKAKEIIDWDGWQKKVADMRAEGRLVGIGIGTTLDSGTNNFGQSVIVNPDSIFSGNTETCRIKIDLDGSVVVMLGSVPQGQGHETVTAQVIADDLGINPDMIKVRTGFDSAWNTYSGMSGTIASQFAVTGLAAAHGAAEKLKEELREIGSFALECNPDDIEFSVGDMGPQVNVKGSPDRAINYWMLSNLVSQNSARLPEELRGIDFNVRYTYRPPFSVPDRERKFGNLTLTYASLLNIAIVEVDEDTCQPKILDYAIVDDCGVAINPKIVEGQISGGVSHGIGASMQEAFQYDGSGNLITSTFTDYAPLTSMNVPDFKHAVQETPSPFTFNGAKGCGESGGTGICAISAAIQDALFDKGVIMVDSHNSPSQILELMQNPNRDSVVEIVK